MISISCDLCGEDAFFGLKSTTESVVFVYTANLTAANHHLCRKCAEKIGILPASSSQPDKDTITDSNQNTDHSI